MLERDIDRRGNQQHARAGTISEMRNVLSPVAVGVWGVGSTGGVTRGGSDHRHGRRRGLPSRDAPALVRVLPLFLTLHTRGLSEAERPTSTGFHRLHLVGARD